MNKFLLAASAAVAMVAMAPSASAAVYNSGDANGITLTPEFLSDGFSSETLPVGTFQDVFNFFVPISGLASAQSMVTSIPSSSMSDFMGGLYSGTTLLSSFTFQTIEGGILGVLTPVYLEGNMDYQLVFSGNALKDTGYGGNLVITPVPEPTTWAMMVLGIAAIGFTMRRAQTTRVAFS